MTHFLGVGFKYFYMFTKNGEIIQFDAHIFEARSWTMVSSWWVTALRMAWTTGRWRKKG